MKPGVTSALCVAAIVSTCLVVWQPWKGSKPVPPAWRTEMDKRVPMWTLREGRFAASVYDEIAHMRNEFLRQDEWTSADVDWIIAQATRVPVDWVPPAVEPPNEEQVDPCLADEAMTAIIARLKYHGPVDPGAAPRLTELMLAWSRSANATRRMSMTQNLVWTDLVRDPAVRARVEEMTNDPLPIIAANARRQLAAWEEKKRAEKEGGR